MVPLGRRFRVRRCSPLLVGFRVRLLLVRLPWLGLLSLVVGCWLFVLLLVRLARPAFALAQPFLVVVLAPGLLLLWQSS